MLIATFTDATGWTGREITYSGDSFVLSGHGPIRPQDVLEYGRLGHIEWAPGGAQALVHAKASGKPPVLGVKIPLGGVRGMLIGTASYLGGIAYLGPAQRGSLWLTEQYVGISGKPGIPVASLASIEVSGDQVAKTKVAGPVFFGLVGAMAAKGTRDRTYVMPTTRDGETAFYELLGQSPMSVKATIGPLAHELGVDLL